MRTPLYAIDGDSSPKNSQNPSLCAKNRLDLLPEHIAQIGSAFILQLSLARLKAQEVRILSTIYSQTIAYNKCEDDMNGKRLEQLTGIRSDHANEAVRRLEDLNIIITRRGRYGKWMSINFDFPHWGQIRPESQTNNPRCLLSEVYRVALPDNEANFQLHCILDSSKKAPLNDESLGITQQQITSTSANNEKITAEKPKQPKQSSKPSAPSIPFELHFPDSLSKKLRKNIVNHLKGIKIPQQAQRLLDYFAKCLIKRSIRNPIAYFIGLKNRLLKGQLDLPEDDIVFEKKQKVDQILIKQRLEYQEAVSDYEHLKKCIQLTMKEKDCAFDKALRRMGYHTLWKTACQRLETIKKAQKIYHKSRLPV